MSLIEQLRTRTASLTAKEVATLLSVGLRTIYQACERGHIPHTRMGTRVSFDPHDIADWWEQKKIPAWAYPKRARAKPVS